MYIISLLSDIWSYLDVSTYFIEKVVGYMQEKLEKIYPTSEQKKDFFDYNNEYMLLSARERKPRAFSDRFPCPSATLYPK